MKKILDFILIFLLIFFIFNFFANKDKEKKVVESIIFKTTESSYTVPAGVQLEVINNTTEEVKFNTCENISLRDNLGEIVIFPEIFCKTIVLQPSKIEKIDYSGEFKKFEQEGNYTFEMNLGEKKYTTLFEIEYKGIIGKTFVGLVYKPIYNLMVGLLTLFSYSLGWSIIVITIIIRLFLLWPQHKMMLSQKKLQALQPKIKKIQKENKGNQQQIGVKLMALYKKEKVNPMGSCGFMLIQMPILLVMYRIILNIKDPSNTFYIYDFLSNFDISMISYNFFGIDLIGKGGFVGAALALFIGIIQFIQVKLSLNLKKKDDCNDKVVLEKKKGANDYSSMMPDPNTMNKFMLYGMPVMVGFFTYSLFAGVGIYWGMSTIFAIFQQLVVNKVLKKSS